MKERGGGALMHVYVWEHIVSLSYRTDLWIFTKLGRDEVFMIPFKCCCFSAWSVQGRIQGGAKIGHGGPSSTNFFFRPEGYINKPNAYLTIIYKHVGWSVVIFVSILKSNFWRIFDIFFDLVIFPYFYTIFIDFYAVKCLIYIYFV